MLLVLTAEMELLTQRKSFSQPLRSCSEQNI